MSVTVVGNLTRDPEIRFTKSGKAVANLSVAVNKRKGDNEVTTFLDVVTWDSLAENVGASLGAGTRVVVTGELNHQTWEAQDGTKRTKIEIVADEVSPSLRWATAAVTKSSYRDRPAPAYEPDEAPF